MTNDYSDLVRWQGRESGEESVPNTSGDFRSKAVVRDSMLRGVRVAVGFRNGESFCWVTIANRECVERLEALFPALSIVNAFFVSISV